METTTPPEAPKARRGRPPNPQGRKTHPPARQLGRVDSETWERLKAAARKAGKSFSDWALSLLLPHA